MVYGRQLVISISFQRKLNWHAQHFSIFLFVDTAAGIVPCGGPKELPTYRPLCSLYFTYCPLRSAEIV